MSWDDVAPWRDVTVVGAVPRTIRAAVMESAPEQNTASAPGQTSQRVQLLVLPSERLSPPARLDLGGARTVRVLGTQPAPWPDAPAIVTAEAVNPDLPDDIEIVAFGARVLDSQTGRYVTPETIVWEGPAHLRSGVPLTVESGGEDAPMDRVTVTTPWSAPYAEGYGVRVVQSAARGLQGATFTMSGEIKDSTAELRRSVAYRMETNLPTPFVQDSQPDSTIDLAEVFRNGAN